MSHYKRNNIIYTIYEGDRDFGLNFDTIPIIPLKKFTILMVIIKKISIYIIFVKSLLSL